MTEPLDILDAEGRRTGRTALRGRPRGEGEYVLVVHIYLYRPDGRFLLQKRSMSKELFPGVWDVTGGAVTAGEESRDAAVREVAEEVGVRLLPAELTLIARLKRGNHFLDLWAARKDFSPEDCVLQKEEVDEVKLASPREVLELVSGPVFRDAEYAAVLENWMLEESLL